GRLLHEPTSASFANARAAQVPYMVGSTSDEASVFGLMGFDRKVLAERFGVDLDALRRHYGDASRIDEAELLRQVQTDFIFTSASLGMATLAAAAGSPTYAYHFDYVRESEAAAAKGAAHCADMPYSFGLVDTPAADDARISAMMQDYLVSFVRDGDPNVAGRPPWPRFGTVSPATLVIGAATQAVPEFRARQLAPWYRRWERESGEALPRH
ncbi:MAG TPA: carboxylesterase family protein, partial [Luteimonas sp.]|nr:carboxylesterase family protein [Luteimonas sp.]